MIRVLNARNRWLVLGLLATVALVAALILVVLSFTGVIGGGSATPHDAVADYIEQVNATQRSFGIERDRVGKVYARARKDPQGLSGNVADLDRSATTLRKFDRRLRALDPPVEAAELHLRLIVLSAAEATFASEIAHLGRYLPALTRERRAVGVAGQNLQRDLRATSSPKDQAATFDRFALAVAAAAKPLQSTTAPKALRPVKAQEIARTAELSASARTVARALREGSTVDARTHLDRFSRAAAGSGNAVERASVIAFDAQARRITTLRRRVAEERSGLDREVR